jgi:hypothetical protein
MRGGFWRGEFRTSSGLILPNNLTDYGAEEMLKMALQGDDGTLVASGGSFWIGLCVGLPTLGLQIEDLVEPTIGTNGYARKEITRDSTGWPNSGTVNGQFYLETADLIWEASGGAFDQDVQRLFFMDSETDTTGDLIALSASLPDPITIDESTLEVNRTFRYRIYSR